MDSILQKARTVEEAVAIGLERLKAAREDVDVEIVEGAEAFGGQQGGYVVVRLGPKTETSAAIEGFAAEILKLMGFSARVHSIDYAHQFVIQIETAGANGLLIGRGGEVLTAFQHILNRIVRREGLTDRAIAVDVGRYRERRAESLRSMAMRAAAEVRSLQKEITLQPLPPAERRIIHLALQQDPEVKTHSVGWGPLKRVVISPVPVETIEDS
ncbi:MAG: RNA-binding cell elongation regulator Jag/EloR [bacterium]